MKRSRLEMGGEAEAGRARLDWGSSAASTHCCLRCLSALQLQDDVAWMWIMHACMHAAVVCCDVHLFPCSLLKKSLSEHRVLLRCTGLAVRGQTSSKASRTNPPQRDSVVSASGWRPRLDRHGFVGTRDRPAHPVYCTIVVKEEVVSRSSRRRSTVGWVRWCSVPRLPSHTYST